MHTYSKHMIKKDTYTRVNIKLELKGYPYGKLCKLHFWLDGFFEKSEIEKYVDEEFKFDIVDGDIEGITEELIERAYIDKIVYTNDRSSREGFGNVIFDSSLTIVSNPPSKKNNKEKGEKDKKPKNLVLHETSTEDLQKLKDKIDVELLKRQYFLSDDEYNFYKINQSIVKLEDVKDMYKKFKGDAFKIKKMNIRNILVSKNLLVN